MTFSKIYYFHVNFYFFQKNLCFSKNFVSSFLCSFSFPFLFYFFFISSLCPLPRMIFSSLLLVFALLASSAPISYNPEEASLFWRFTIMTDENIESIRVCLEKVSVPPELCSFSHFIEHDLQRLLFIQGQAHRCERYLQRQDRYSRTHRRLR